MVIAQFSLADVCPLRMEQRCWNAATPQKAKPSSPLSGPSANRRPLAAGQRFRACPVCDSHGVATGGHTVEWVPEDWDKETGQVTSVYGEVWFTARKFHCPVCNLRLDSEAEIEKAKIDTSWEIENAGWRGYEPQDDDDAAYERWREESYER